MVLCVVGIAALTYANIRNTVAIYYFEYLVPGGKDLFGPVMTTGAAAFIAGVMLTAPLSKRFGKRNFYMVAMTLTLILTIGFYYIPPENIALVWGAHALISLFAAPTAPLVWAMYADTADYSEWKWGRRATGLIFSAASFAQKLGWALGGAGTGWLLAYFGYVPNQVQDPATVNGIKLMMSWIPAAGALIAIVALWYYTLDEATVDQMGRELEERRAREGTPETAAEHLQRQAFVPPLPKQLVEFIMSPEAPGSADGAGNRPPSAPGGPGWTGPAGAATSTLTAKQRAALDADFQAFLKAGVHGLCFSPYVEGQAPGAQVSEAQIRARLEIVRPYTRWVRTFSCTDGLEQIPRIAHELGLKTLVGAWLGQDRDINGARSRA